MTFLKEYEMKKQLGVTLVELVVVIFGLLFVCVWPYNLYRLSQCDFDAPYKCEVIHAIGVVVPPAAIVTMWFTEDK
jgi:hypothetical protein